MSDVSLNSGLLSPPKNQLNGCSIQDVNGHEANKNNRAMEQQWQLNDGKSRASASNVNGESINQWRESSIDEQEAQVAQKVKQWDSSRINNYKYSLPPQPMPQSPTRPSNGQTANGNWSGSHHESMSDISLMNGVQGNNSKQLIAHSARVQTPQRHHSESVLYLDRERNQRKLFPLSTTQPQETR